MSEDGWDVNVEYEKLFGAAKRVNLFDSEEEYYELRQFIADQPQETFVANYLPFEGVIISREERKQKRERIKKALFIEETHKVVQTPPNDSKLLISDKHFFFIKEEGVCNAKGYYNEELKYFFISKDSLVSYDTDLIYLINDTEHARENFLNKICEEANGYYKVVRDAKCRSASAAACYVLGCVSDETSWKDSEGRTLSEVYPDVFSTRTHKKEDKPKKEQSSKKKQETPKKVELSPKLEEPKNKKRVAPLGRPPQYYYIIRENIGKRSCNAKGTYDKVNNKFVIYSGSELAYEVTSSYRFTASDIKRKKFIQLNCANSKLEYKLKRDAICNTPDEAASFVLGENANGWVEWKSKDGIPLERYISKVQI